MMNNAPKSNARWILPILLLVAAGGVYANRGRIGDWLAENQKPEVAEVAYADIAEPSLVPLNDDGGGVPVEVEDEDEDAVPEPEPVPEPDVEPEEESQAPSAVLPAEFNLAVPFTSQAPKSVWDEVHEETCEEAAVLMAAYYYQGKFSGKIDSDAAEAELLKMVEFENSFFGFYKDTTAAQTASLLEAYFQMNAELVLDPTIDEIKSALVVGHPVIVPTAGQQLGNPNFTGDGPPYHMIVIKGYTKDGFITNDPGTRLGADYFYSYTVLMNAIHDWNGGDVANGQKIIIVATP